MQDQPISVPCGACFESGVAVNEEAYPDGARAFARFTLLFNAGDSPALCRKDDSQFHVCHRERPAGQRPWPRPAPGQG